MSLAGLAERLRGRIVSPVDPHEIPVLELSPGVQRERVRALHRAKAAVAAAVVAGTDRAAAGVRDRSQAGGAVRHDYAHGSAPLALKANAMGPKPPAAAAPI